MGSRQWGIALESGGARICPAARFANRDHTGNTGNTGATDTGSTGGCVDEDGPRVARSRRMRLALRRAMRSIWLREARMRA